MIRIDLGKANRKQGEAVRKVAAQLKLEQPYNELLAKFDNDFGRLAIFVVSLAIAVLPILLVGEYERVIRKNFARKMIAADTQIAAIDQEIEGFATFKQELDSYENQKVQVTQRIKVITNLLLQRGTPVNTLDSVGQSLPERVWLESMLYEANSKSSERIIVTGKALSNEDISDFVDRLSQSSYLRNIRITTVDTANVGGLDLKTFGVDMDASPVGTPDTSGAPAAGAEASATDPGRALGSENLE
jgi:Tfp pilus assembly protein PilN